MDDLTNPLFTFRVLVASARDDNLCMVRAVTDAGEDIIVCCHIAADRGDGTITVIPLARMLSKDEVATMELKGRALNRPVEMVHLQVLQIEPTIKEGKN